MLENGEVDMKYKCKEMRKLLAPNMKKRYFSKWFPTEYANKLVWALSLKIDEDVFHGCDGYNHILKRIDVYRDKDGRIEDMYLVGKDGHVGDLFGCVTQKTPSTDEINQYHWGWIEFGAEDFKIWWPEKYQKYEYAFKNKIPVCDERGLCII